MRLEDLLCSQRNGVPIGGLVSCSGLQKIPGTRAPLHDCSVLERRGPCGSAVRRRRGYGQRRFLRELSDKRGAGGFPRGVQFDVAKPDVDDSDDLVRVEWLDLTISLLKLGRLEVRSKLNEIEWVLGSSEWLGNIKCRRMWVPQG